MLVAGSLCGVIFLGLERAVLGDRRMPQGPGDMDVDEYGRAMNNFRQRRGVDTANHIRAGMAPRSAAAAGFRDRLRADAAQRAGPGGRLQ